MSFARRLADTRPHAAANPDYNPPVTPATRRTYRSNHKKRFLNDERLASWTP